MSFISPIFLLGLLAVSLPIIIHMMGRRRAPSYRFSAMEFILRSQKKVAARLKLEQLLLLLLRAAIIAFIATALAKPLLKAGPALAPDAPSCNVLIIDNSYSMGYTVAGRTLLERAKDWARQFVRSLSPSDESCVITVFPVPEAPPRLNTDKSEAMDVIDRIEPSYYSTDVSSCLDDALRALGSSRKQSKRIFLFTDLTKHGWERDRIQEVQKNKLERDQVRLHIVDVSEGKPLPNTAVTGLQYEYDWTRKDEQVLLSTTVANFSDTPLKDLLVRAWIDGKDVAQGFLQLEPWESSTKEFLLDVSGQGGTQVSVEIPEDHLPADNKRFFSLPDVRDIKVLLIDGAPSINIYQGATFYLEKALNPARLHASHIHPTLMNTNEVRVARFKDYDLVILANVERLDGTKISELKTYAAEGGNIFFCLGDRVTPEYYNSTFAGLVPRLRMAVDSPDGKPLEFAPLDTTHSLLRVFAGERKDVLSSPHFHKVFLVEPEMDGSTTSIISYSNGAPALIELPYGKGRALTMTSTINRDWTDLPVKPLFLPLVQQICRYMTDNLIESVSEDVLVGEDCELPVYERDKAGNVEVLDPKGNLSEPVIDDSVPHAPLVFSETHFPGVYTVRGAGARVSFTVNVDPGEGDLTKIDRSQLEEALGRENVSFSISTPMKGAEGAVEGKRLWPTLLFAALCLMSLEAFVSWRQL